jgi:hypothetical protein
VTVAESIHHEQGPSAATDVRLINTHLYHLAYILNVKSPSFTSMVVWISQAGQPTVYKPNGEFSLTLLQCGQILQDIAAEISKFYLITDLDPYKYDLGRIKGPPRGTSPLATYSSQDHRLAWRHLEAQMPGTQVSNEGTQLP